MQSAIQNWLINHGLTNFSSEDMNLPLNEVDGLDSIVIVALILEIEELSGEKIPKETFLNISKMSVNELIVSLKNI